MPATSSSQSVGGSFARTVVLLQQGPNISCLSIQGAEVCPRGLHDLQLPRQLYTLVNFLVRHQIHLRSTPASAFTLNPEQFCFCHAHAASDQ